MLLLNFTHPLTARQSQQVETIAGAPIEEVHLAHVQINQEQRLEPQIAALVDNLGFSSEEWQTLPMLVNPPGYAPAASVLLTELHGRMGHFPAIIRLRPKRGPVPDYEVAELLNLQAVRESARERR